MEDLLYTIFSQLLQSMNVIIICIMIIIIIINNNNNITQFGAFLSYINLFSTAKI